MAEQITKIARPCYQAEFRFYEELNDFLPIEKRKQSLNYHFRGTPSIKDAIEAQGVPHPEVDLIIVKGISVGFDYHLQHQDRVAVYPVFESLDISPITRLRTQPLRRTAFILDVHLGKLARLLRMLGFDAVYQNNFDDPEIIALGVAEQRIILTRDRGLLKHSCITHGYCIRSTDPMVQVREVLQRFDLHSRIQSFRKCSICNGDLRKVDKETILSQIQAGTQKYYCTFYQCRQCHKIYWRGSHYARLKARLSQVLELPDWPPDF
ncbi:Mut7-C ubiquitin/RNAse domain-containing protein [candidate division KSB1 bacterium]|nr:Mut7-C ubiquitin/RNAse domain-containing protein [candidate division KSB1 bacterium]